jgi:hypothetical protein
VVFGAPEKGTGFLNVEEDKVFVTELLAAMGADSGFCVEYRRLGKPREDAAKPRVLRLRFDTEEHKFDVLKKAKNLKGSRYSDVYVKPDLTPRQLKADKVLYDAMKAVNVNGNKLVRKYRGKLVPVEVPLNGTAAPLPPGRR